ncbi:MAG TPA: hypothetical protein DEO60_11795 [Bacteroidales bacterium]|jgi:hypothetical protein|nr:hypothetical protein [Bacteroidales bacterium]HBZ21802.1 hypothetical protein [Bacteroidales bacterium]
MKKNILTRLSCLILVTSISQIVSAQEQGSISDTIRKEAVKIFLDCQSCDMNYTRQQIPYVNFVRDVKEAQVFILITQQNAGSGGTQYTFTFQGLGVYNGMNDTLVYTSNPDETSTIVREKKNNRLQMGLMKYVARTPLSSEIEIRYNAELERELVVDKWNNWVFSLGTEPQFQAEESDRQLQLRNSFNVTKVTPDIKFELELDQSYSRRRVIEDDDFDTTYVTNEFQGDNLFVKSLGEHWSAGIKWNIGTSTRENYGFRTDILPSVEYDLFPYSEATHRQLRFLYSVGMQYNNYNDSTIYNKLAENLFKQEFNIAFQIQKKWGSVNLSLLASNYFNDFSKNRVELNTSLNFRIFKGLALQISGGIAHINDQVNLKKGDISEADRLLELRELSTQYRIEGGIGLTYTFGSIYNNVVNPRFGFGGGGGQGGPGPDYD